MTQRLKRLLAGFLTVLCLGAVARAQQVVAVLSSSDGPYQAAFESFVKDFGSVVAYRLPQERPGIGPRTRVVVAFGGEAALRPYPKGVVVIACLAPGLPEPSSREGPTVFVAMKPRPAELLTQMRKLQPRLKRLAVLWNSASTGTYLDALKRVAADQGIEIDGVDIPDLGDLPNALRSLSPKPDALWLAPDPRLITPESFQTIKQFSWDDAIPFYAPTAGLAAAGAAAAVSISAPDLGRRLAGLSRQALSGEPLPAIAYSEKTELIVNTESAAKAGLALAPEALGRADKVLPVKLQNKFMALLLPAGLAAAAMIVLLIRRSVHSVILNGLEKNVSTVAEAAAQNAVPGFESGREDQLLPQLQALQSREGALYAAALDARGKVLAHTTISRKGELIGDAFTRAALVSDQTSVHVLRPAGGPVLEISAPVWFRPEPVPEEVFMLSGQARAGARTRLGLLKVGIPLAPILETESRILRDILLIIAATGLLVAGIVLLLVRRILKPVSGLLAGISRIAQGRYDVEVPILSTDEIGALALSFNRMSAELSRTTVSRNYMEGILANMIDLLVVTDREGRIETMNPAMLGTLSYSAAEMIGRPLADLFQDAPGALRGQELPAAVADGGVRDLEVTLRTKSGGAIPALFSASVLNDRHGRLRGYIGVAKDMTERKRAEEALLAAKAAAEASSKELEAFSYSVAHDLRAPLRAVDGFSQVVLDRYADKLDEQGKDYLRRVRGGSRRMGQLIDDLLNLSRITRTTMRVESVALTGLAREVASELQRSQPDRKVEFDIEEGLKAKGDPDLLRVVLVNLLGNAWKYTGKKPAARIAFGAERREGATVYFVRDDGAGFDMAFSKKLFMPFNRLHSASEFEGTGIGLATVQRVVERHGGRVWGEGEVDKGATFRFTLWEARSHGDEIDPARRR